MRCNRPAVPTLRELQRRFAAALFADADALVSADVRADGNDVHTRLGVYRKQLHAIFARTLALEFPVSERLVGDEFFRRLAGEFQAVHPSRAGDLQHIGAHFAAFLHARFGGGPYDYLADVAELEWALQECTVAAEAPAFDSQALRSVDPANYAELHFDFHPACRLVRSRYPTLAIWRANQAGAASADSIDLGSGETRVLAQRSARGVALHSLSAPEFVFLQKLAEDSSLSAALEAAQGNDPAFDPGPALRRCGALNAISAARLHQMSGSETRERAAGEMPEGKGCCSGRI
jgi:hypothetical protein